MSGTLQTLSPWKPVLVVSKTQERSGRKTLQNESHLMSKRVGDVFHNILEMKLSTQPGLRCKKTKKFLQMPLDFNQKSKASEAVKEDAQTVVKEISEVE